MKEAQLQDGGTHFYYWMKRSDFHLKSALCQFMGLQPVLTQVNGTVPVYSKENKNKSMEWKGQRNAITSEFGGAKCKNPN